MRTRVRRRRERRRSFIVPGLDGTAGGGIESGSLYSLAEGETGGVCGMVSVAFATYHVTSRHNSTKMLCHVGIKSGTTSRKMKIENCFYILFFLKTRSILRTNSMCFIG